jgi:hypothetical protein
MRLPLDCLAYFFDDGFESAAESLLPAGPGQAFGSDLQAVRRSLDDQGGRIQTINIFRREDSKSKAKLLEFEGGVAKVKAEVKIEGGTAMNQSGSEI